MFEQHRQAGSLRFFRCPRPARRPKRILRRIATARAAGSLHAQLCGRSIFQCLDVGRHEFLRCADALLTPTRRRLVLRAQIVAERGSRRNSASGDLLGLRNNAARNEEAQLQFLPYRRLPCLRPVASTDNEINSVLACWQQLYFRRFFQLLQ